MVFRGTKLTASIAQDLTGEPHIDLFTDQVKQHGVLVPAIWD